MSSAAVLQTKTCPRCGGTFGGDAVFCPSDGTRLEADSAPGQPEDPYIGTTIHGDIELRAVAGSGAMGKVYRAYQRGVERDVAVKIHHRELSGNGALVQRFHREARIASKLQHPHVVEVFLAGQLADGALYIVMEYLDGFSLASALSAAGGRMPVERVLPIALQICDAVGEAHARGIVHRDLKPENVMLVHRGGTSDWVKVLDFGIAKVSAGEQSMQTAAGLIFGTARYISPEGAQGAAVGPPGDVYSIAVILYHLLAGKTPFEAENAVGLLMKHLYESPPPLSSASPGVDVPEAIARVVMDNLAKEPTRRAPSARALGQALATAAKAANVSFSDVGVVARMSIADASPQGRPLEATLDDGAVLRLPARTGETASRDVRAAVAHAMTELAAQAPPLSPSATAPVVSPMRPPAWGDAVSSAMWPAAGAARGAPTGAVDQAASKPSVGDGARGISEEPPGEASGVVSAMRPAPAGSDDEARARRSPGRRRTVAIVVLAFLLGAALTFIVTQEVAQRRDRADEALVQRARRALAAGNYVHPRGESVRDLVATGLARRPDDAELARIQSDAAHELVTRAMAARSAGDLAQARDLVKTALELDPTDRAAHILVDQYDDELRLEARGGGTSRVMVGLPTTDARVGRSLELTATLVVGGGPPAAPVNDPRFTLVGPGLPAGGKVLAASRTEPGRFIAAFVPPQVGAYEVTFEANTAGIPFRAEKSLDVR